jgi:hypothetical protein
MLNIYPKSLNYKDNHHIIIIIIIIIIITDRLCRLVVRVPDC